MEVTTTELTRCDVIKATGRVTSFTAPQLEDEFLALQAKNRFNFVFDMSQVDFMSSAGLRVMINVQQKCKEDEKGELVLASIPARVYETLELAGFVSLFQIYDTVVQAVGSF
jgi:anti-sigma B factor antagonist